jgi:hypothetical protein
MKAKLVCGALLLHCLMRSSSIHGADAPLALNRDSSDAFFTNGAIVRLRIDLDRAAQQALQQNSRRYVQATVTEGDTVFRGVGLHLKGNYTFQFLDQKPCLTPPPRPAALRGNLDWRTFSTDFPVTEATEVIELTCEVRGFKGTVCVDKSSLVLVRLSAR